MNVCACMNMRMYVYAHGCVYKCGFVCVGLCKVRITLCMRAYVLFYDTVGSHLP